MYLSEGNQNNLYFFWGEIKLIFLTVFKIQEMDMVNLQRPPRSACLNLDRYFKWETENKYTKNKLKNETVLLPIEVKNLKSFVVLLLFRIFGSTQT